MPIRPATKADIPSMAAIMAASFGPDPLFQVMFPHQSQYPEAFVQAFEEYLWLSWYDYKRCLLVSYHETSTDVDQGHQLGETEDGRRGGEAEPLLPPKTRSIARKNEVLTGVAELERVGSGWEHVYGIWERLGPRKAFCPVDLSRFITTN